MTIKVPLFKKKKEQSSTHSFDLDLVVQTFKDVLIDEYGVIQTERIISIVRRRLLERINLK